MQKIIVLSLGIAFYNRKLGIWVPSKIKLWMHILNIGWSEEESFWFYRRSNKLVTTSGGCQKAQYFLKISLNMWKGKILQIFFLSLSYNISTSSVLYFLVPNDDRYNSKLAWSIIIRDSHCVSHANVPNENSHQCMNFW